MEQTPQFPRKIDQLLGYASAALSLQHVRYPVTMSRERLDGTVTIEPIKIEDEDALRSFCEKTDDELGKTADRDKGYWRIRSL